jgi:hypothetical protein
MRLRLELLKPSMSEVERPFRGSRVCQPPSIHTTDSFLYDSSGFQRLSWSCTFTGFLDEQSLVDSGGNGVDFDGSFFGTKNKQTSYDIMIRVIPVCEKKNRVALHIAHRWSAFSDSADISFNAT